MIASNLPMRVHPHLRTTGHALKQWFVAMLYDALAVGSMWLIGLLILRVDFALFWALIAGLCQFVPNVGSVIAVIGPALAAAFDGGWERFIYVLMLYAIIVVIDGLFLQPYLMKKSTRVPIWASIISPILLGILIPFWGVLLAAPLLAVVYAFKSRRPLPPSAGTDIQPR
ncbi:MAG TPA: AI-2E family transporter [Terriglobales bacterium]